MKKAKIMLSAIAVLAVVGGALAFNTNKLQKTVFTIDTEANVCTIPVVATTVVGDASGPAFTTTAYNTFSTTVCKPATPIYPTN